MSRIETQQLADDAPRANPWTDDVLGFAPFSARLAQALVKQNARNGYVFGLHGEWGSGKSTVLNFVRCHLKKWKDESRPDMSNLTWFSFDPWIVSGHQDLAAAFFKVLSEKLADGAERRDLFRRSAKSAIDTGAAKIIDAAAALGATMDPTGGTAAKLSAAGAKLGAKKAAERWLSEPSVQKVYHQLVKRLEASNRRFIVFVDDIDRLTSVEIRSLMQMVKTVGRLPNVTYCLCYDRQIVWAALRDLAPTDGTRSGYAEKIVQHELEVPVPSRTGLMRMLEIGMPGVSPQPTGMRWIEMLRSGLHRWLRHPRDVVRLSNAMQFSWAALRDEIDPYDVLCMEALRLFDRKVFDWIRDNRNLLLGDSLPTLMKEDEKAEEAARIEAMLRQDARADVIPVLRILFPEKAGMFGRSRGFSNERWPETVVRRGIATRPGYTAYFSLAPSSCAIPKRLIEEACTPGVTSGQHRAFIDRALNLKDELGNTLVAEYLHELAHRIRAMPDAGRIALLDALIGSSVEIFEADEDSFASGPASAHHALIGEVMGRLGPDKTADALSDIFAASESLGGMASIYVIIGRSLGMFDADDHFGRSYVPKERFHELAPAILEKIEAADDTTLTALPVYYDVARAWEHVGAKANARAWLAREARRSGHSLAKLSRGLLNTSFDGTKKRFSMSRSVNTEIYDLEAIQSGCEAFIDAPGLSDEERARIAALKSGPDGRLFPRED